MLRYEYSAYDWINLLVSFVKVVCAVISKLHRSQLVLNFVLHMCSPILIKEILNIKVLHSCGQRTEITLNFPYVQLYLLIYHFA